MQIIMLEDLRSGTIVCFAFIHYAWLRNQTISIAGWVPQNRVDNYCVLCTVKTKRTNKNMQQRTLSSFITIPLYNYGCRRLIRELNQTTTEKKRLSWLCMCVIKLIWADFFAVLCTTVLLALDVVTVHHLTDVFTKLSEYMSLIHYRR